MMMNDTISWTFSLLRFLNPTRKIIIYIFFLLFMTQKFLWLVMKWVTALSQPTTSHVIRVHDTMGLYQSMGEWEWFMTLHSISCDIRIHLFVCKLQLHSKPKTKNKKVIFTYLPWSLNYLPYMVSLFIFSHIPPLLLSINTRTMLVYEGEYVKDYLKFKK